VGRVPEVRNDSEDFGRDPVDRGEAVPPEPNETEDLESVLLESVDLKSENENTRARERPSIHRFISVGSTSVVTRIALATLKGVFESSNTTCSTDPDVPCAKIHIL
jgi:hypothetical protein